MVRTACLWPNQTGLGPLLSSHLKTLLSLRKVQEGVLVWGAVRGQSRGQEGRSSGKDSLSEAHPDRPGPTPVFPPQGSTRPGEVCEEVLLWRAVWGQSRGLGDRSSGKDSLSVAQPDRPGPTPVFPPQVSSQPEEGEVHRASAGVWVCACA